MRHVRRRGAPRRATACVAALTVVCAGLASPASARSGTPATDALASARLSSFAPSSGKDAADYWTKARMENATSADQPSLDGESDASLDAPSTSSPTVIDPAAATESTDTTGSTYTSADGASIPFSTSEISSGDYPYSAYGRIFFRAHGESWSCSGTVVTSDNRSVVFTAGHCVFQLYWVRDWIFVPAYHDGIAPYGKWTAKTLAAPAGWTDQMAPAYDIGAAVLHRNGNGQRIADLVGSQGIAWNLPRSQTYTAFGYPAVGAFDGESLWACESDFGWSDKIRGPNSLAIGCNLTYGASGGGWIIERNGETYLNSVTSYTHPGERWVSYGPYFGDAAAALYRKVSRL